MNPAETTFDTTVNREPSAGARPPSSVKPYNEEGCKKSQVSTMFDNIAPWYDFLNHFLSLGIDITWRKKAIAALKPEHPLRILDVATGTGDLAIEAIRQIPDSKVIGVDISNKMLQIGREKIAKKKLSEKIELQLGDSENLPFADNTFDAVTVAFGVRNFENLDKGLAEIFRVMRPGATLAVLEFSKPTMFPFKQTYHFYFSTVLPFIGKITSKDPKAYTYLYESVQAFPDGLAFVKRLENVKFLTHTPKAMTLGVCSLYLAKKPLGIA